MSKRTKTYLIIGGAAVVGFFILSKVMASRQEATGSAALLQGEYTPAKGAAYLISSTADAVKGVFAALGQKQTT